MPDNVSGAVCTVENKATLFPAAGAPGSLIHTALVHTPGTPHRPRPEAQNEHRRDCLSPAASSQGRPREHRLKVWIPCPWKGQLWGSALDPP